MACKALPGPADEQLQMRSTMPQAPPRAMDQVRPPLLGSIGLPHYFTMHLIGAAFPAAAGVVLFGWRALLTMGLVVGSTVGASIIWKRTGPGADSIRLDHATYLALLLSLTLPAHLATRQPIDGLVQPWMILPALGLGLAGLIRVMGGPDSGRGHPVLMLHLLLALLFLPALVPRFTLVPQHMVFGDVLKAAVSPSLQRGAEPWILSKVDPPYQAMTVDSPGQNLGMYTRGRGFPELDFLSLDGLLRDRLPPLEDLVIGGQPAPIGQSSAIALIVGGLFLLYRGLMDYRIPLFIMLSAWVTLLILPVPVSITESGAEWRWLVMREPAVGWATALTFVNYSLLASPLLFTAFFLATSPAIRPMPRCPRWWWACLIGVSAAVLQLYVSVSLGPYLALLMVGLLTPVLDRWWRPRTRV